MKTTTRITHKRNEPDKRRYRVKPGELGVDLGHLKQVAAFRINVDDTGHGVIDILAAKEPEPIPMSEMKPGEFGCVATVDDGKRIVSPGDWVQRHRTNGTSQRLSDAHIIESTGCTVHILPLGESLLLEVVKDKPEAEDEPAATPESESADRRCIHCKHRDVGHFSPPCNDDCLGTDQHKHFEAAGEAEPDDQFERLADGTRKQCGNCADGYESPDCTKAHDAPLPKDIRGVGGNAHACWRPVEPETLGHALWHGDADAIADEYYGDARRLIADCVPIIGDAAERIFDAVDNGDGYTVDNIRMYAGIFVELRDRLGLFKGEENE